MSIVATDKLAENRFHDGNMVANRGECKCAQQHPVTVMNQWDTPTFRGKKLVSVYGLLLHGHPEPVDWGLW